MGDFLTSWLFDFGRVSLFLAVAALSVGLVLRYLRPTSPQTHRAVWCLVLVVGWLVVRLPISVPWYEPAPAVSQVVSVEEGIEVSTSEPIELFSPEIGEELPQSAQLVELEVTDRLPEVTYQLPEVTDRSVVAAPEDTIKTEENVAAVPPSLPEPISAVPPATNWLDRWPLYLLVAWLLGMAVALIRWLAGYIDSIRSMSTALLPDEATLRQWQLLLNEYGIEREIPLRLTRAMGPLLCRWPDGYELVIPKDFWESLTPSARLSVMRHELEHYRRGDVWKSLVMRVLALPHWFNPAAWWAVRRFDEAAEWACDEAAIGDNDRTTYARTLLVLAESSLGGGSCHPSMSRWNLPARIRRLVTSSDRKDSIMKKITLFTLAILLFTFCLVRIDLVAKTPAPSKEDVAKTSTPAEKIDASEASQKEARKLVTRAHDLDKKKPNVVIDFGDKGKIEADSIHLTIPTEETNRRIDRKRLRYQGKSFIDWENTLLDDLSIETRAEAIKALAAFGSRCYGKRSAEIIARLMREHGGFDTKFTEKTRLLEYSIAAFSGPFAKIDIANTIPAADGVPVLARELVDGNQKSQGFALRTLYRLNHADTKTPKALSALAKYLRKSGAKDSDCHQQRLLAFKILVHIDPTGKMTEVILREEATRLGSKYPEEFIDFAIPDLSGTIFPLSDSHDITPGSRAVAKVAAEYLDEKHPRAARNKAAYALARFLVGFDESVYTKDQQELIFQPVSDNAFQFGQTMMKHLIENWEDLDPTCQSEMIALLDPEQTFSLSGMNNYYGRRLPIGEPPRRVRGMVRRIYSEAKKAAAAKPSDAKLENRKKLISVFYRCLTGEAIPKKLPKRHYRLVYEVAQKKVKPSTIEKLLPIVKQRLKAVAPSAVVHKTDGRRIEIRFDTDNPKEARKIDRMLTRPGTLEFRILANYHDHKELIDKIRGDELLDKEGKRLARWVPVFDNRIRNFKGNAQPGPIRFQRNSDGKMVLSILVVDDPYDITSKYLKRVELDKDARDRFCVAFSFTEEGSKRFGSLTGSNLPDEKTGFRRGLCIIIDGRAYSAPRINSRITNRGIIEGNFTEEEAKELVNVLNSGPLPVSLKRVRKDLPPVKAPKAPKPEGSKPVFLPEEPTAPIGPKSQRKTKQVNLPLSPDYKIEPPDMLRIELDKVVPKTPYRFGTYDVLQVDAINTLLNHPINGYYLVEAEGTINFGPAYGRVKLAGLTGGEAEKATVKQLKKTLREPKVSITLARASGMPSCKGEYQVGPDGTINLKQYGSLRVAGKTVAEVSESIRKRLAKYLQSPKVSVTVSRSRSKYCYLVIDDKIRKRNEINRVLLTGNETILDIMAKVPTMESAKANIQIVRLRTDQKSSRSVLSITWDSLLRSKDKLDDAYSIRPNDRVIISFHKESDKETTLPHEGAMVSLPSYKIEPPDLVQIDLVKLVPLKYQLTPKDELQIDTINTRRNAPINGHYKIDGQGKVDLGHDYGKVKLADMTVAEAEKAVLKHLKTILRNPEVSVQIARATNIQPIRGTYLVGPDGTVNLRKYGSVKISGMTLAEAQKAIAKQLKKTLKDPEVLVDMAAYNSKVYYVISVEEKLVAKMVDGKSDSKIVASSNVMTIPVTGRETVLDALSLLQGEGNMADASIYLLRRKDKKDKRLLVDYKAIISGSDTKANYQIIPGDRLYIEKRKVKKLSRR